MGSSKRGMSTVVTALIALVAVLGTTVYFMSGNIVISPAQSKQQESSTQGTEDQSPNTSVTKEQPAESTQSPATTQQPLLGSESIRVTNVHSWVASDGTGTVTAFAIQNTGSIPTAIKQINMRGFSVPQTSWYSCGPACGTTTNINTELTPDYTPASANLASGSTAFTAGPVSLSQGQATIVYLLNAGSLLPIDAGNTYALQIQAGQASAVQQVLVVSTT